ncbi:MAG: CoA protein activase [Nitrospirae bacterium]|nr:CoA protein activase [Nitrospirota bacterium]
MNYIGLDAGSVAVKIIILNDRGDILGSAYLRHKGRPLHVSLELLKAVTRDGLCITGNGLKHKKTLRPEPDSSLITHHASLSLTGSAGRSIGSILGIPPVNEVVAHAYATRKLYPKVRTIIELGGEDSKLIFLGEDTCSAKDFAMNSVCAAGTGSFLDQQAERLNLSIEEFSRLSLESRKPPRIAGRCSVFAKSDMIHLQQIATPVEDIAAGLCFAVARNFKGSIAKGRILENPVSFQGGVAANKGMVRAFREIFSLDNLFIPEEFALMGAIGSAWKDLDSGRFHAFDLSSLEDFINTEKPQEKGYAPLVARGADFAKRHLESRNGLRVKGNGSKHKEPLKPEPNSSLITNHSSQPLKTYLGVDIGSISTNLAIIDENCNVIAKRYLMTAGRPIEAVKQGLEEIRSEIGDRIVIAGVGTTGSGRYMIADYIGADIVKNEITAQATAAAFIDKDVDTIFEIGGQDSKYIALKNGVIVDFEMNKACAAGTGSFLEEQAEKLNISVKAEFQEIALCAKNPCRLGERCTVFMENSLMANLQRGLPKEELLAGLAYSIVQNYINRVVCKRPIGEKIFFQGGVAFNKAVVAAFENYLGKKVIVPEHHDVTGAIGMALIAREHISNQLSAVSYQQSEGKLKTPNPELRTSFKGFEASQLPYEITSFACKGCSNICEINRINVQGVKDHLYYGGRCEKYDVRKKPVRADLPDLFAFRDEMLWQAHIDRKALYVKRNESTKKTASRFKHHASRGRIGIPFIFYFHDLLPYWTTLLWELGFEVVVSPRAERSIIDLGNETILAETCFPVKAAHGHIAHLIQEEVDAVLVPSFIDLNADIDPAKSGLACPYTQAIPYMAKTAFPDTTFIMPAVRLSRGKNNLKQELRQSLKQFKISSAEISSAMAAANKMQEAFVQTIKEKGREVLESLNDKALVIVGRAYNSFDKGMNLDIPKKIGNLGVLTIPMDFLPLQQEEIRKDWPNMYWRAGQRILSAGRIIASNPLLDAVYIGNFSCGPDSFILKFFEEEMAGKSYLHLELDAHSADAGAITRCEAFLDSIQNRDAAAAIRKHTKSIQKISPSHIKHDASRTVYIPPMSDHAFAIAAAFSYCGTAAEVLPESSQESVDLGRRFVSGKECYPCAVTTGDMIKKALEPGFDPKRSAFFMPSGTGPCRFGQYNIFQRQVIRDLGMEDLPVFSPNQDEHFYKHLGLAGKGYAMRVWEGVVSISLLRKCLLETRPYEKEKGLTDRTYQKHLLVLRRTLSTRNGNIEEVLKTARREFEGIPVQKEVKPLIGIVGEIFVRSNRFSNDNLVRRIEALGGEAYLTPVDEWISYINLMGIRKVLIKKDLSGMITLLSKRFFQKRVEHRLGRLFSGFLRTLHEPDTRTVMQNARPYIHPTFEGEAILSIGKSIDLIRRGASGIVNAMPFGCMPGTIVNALLRGVKNNHKIPCLSIPYDGTESLTTEIQLEAFIDQAREFKKRADRDYCAVKG